MAQKNQQHEQEQQQQQQQHQPRDNHYFDAVHRILLRRIQAGQFQSALMLLALPHIHSDPLFWQTCTYSTGLAAAVLATSFTPSASPDSTVNTAETAMQMGSFVPATQPLSLAVDGVETLAGCAWDCVEASSPQLIGGTPAQSPTPPVAPSATTAAPLATPVASPMTTATIADSAASASAPFSLPELYQILLYCLAHPPPADHHTHTDAVQGSVALLRNLVRLIERFQSPPKDTLEESDETGENGDDDNDDNDVDGDEQQQSQFPRPSQGTTRPPHFTDGHTVDLVSICAALLETVQGQTYENPLSIPSATSTQANTDSQKTVQVTPELGGGAEAMPGALAVARKRQRSPEKTETERPMPTLEPTTTTTTATITRSSERVHDEALLAAMSTASKSLLDVVTSPYTSTDAVQVLQAIAPLPGSTRVLPTFAEVGEFLVNVDDEEAQEQDEPVLISQDNLDRQATAVLDEALAPDRQPAQITTPHEKQNALNQKEERKVAGDDDESTSDEDVTVMEVLLSTANTTTPTRQSSSWASPPTSSPSPRAVPFDVVEPPQSSSAAAAGAAGSDAGSDAHTQFGRNAKTALKASWHSVKGLPETAPERNFSASSSSAVTAGPVAEALPAGETASKPTHDEEAMRVAFAIDAFAKYEEEVAAHVVRLRREAVLKPAAAAVLANTSASGPSPALTTLNPASAVRPREADNRAHEVVLPAPAITVEENDAGRRRRIHFTTEEDTAIIKGVARFGQTSRSFAHIYQAYRSVWQEGRTATKLSDHWRDALKKKAVLMRAPASPSKH